MRRWALHLTILVALIALAIPADAQDAEALRRELEQLKQQLETMQRQYQQTIQDLSDRLQRLETPSPAVPPQSAGGPAPLPSPSPVVSTPESRPAPSVSALELARPREPFALSERRGTGQLLFDMGVTGDFAGSLTSKGVEQARVGSLPGEENRVFPREIEVSFFGQIDPYARAEVRFEAGDALEEDGSRSFNAELAEANLTLMALPWGFQAKGGRMRLRWGYLNEFHQHDRPFIDNPNVLVKFFGDEGLVENGGELAWVAPTPFYLQALLGVFDGDNDVAFGGGSLRDPLVTGRLRTFLDVTDTLAVQVGASAMTGLTTDETHATYAGFDIKFKYTPESWRHPLLTGGGEVLFAHRNNPVTPASAGEEVTAALMRRRLSQDATEPASPTDFVTRDAHGFYLWTELQPWQRWVFGLRYDWTEDPTRAGHEWAIGPYLSFFTTEFLRFRLGYKHTERSGFGAPSTIDELLFQATFILGAHPADLF
jgi:hypothetical protein